VSPPSPADNPTGSGEASPSPADNPPGSGEASRSAADDPTRFNQAILDFSRLAAIDLGRHFGRRKALSHVSFELNSGEIVGLLGPNGAGKSTLLAILGTLLAPSTGRVVYGTVTADAAGAALRARLGMLGHDLYLYPELTARENLLFFARLYGLPDPVAAVAAGLEHAALSSRADDPVNGFSRGMRQRLALERALLHRPRLLLLDEPFTGLDQASSAALSARLQGLRDEGCIIILATHDLEVAEEVVSRTLFLRNGRLADETGVDGDLRTRYLRVVSSGSSVSPP
jgi:ABC-type multidrug transport system ATPase subunit